MKFRQRQVADPRAQQNFEQIETDLPKQFLALASPTASGRVDAAGVDSVTFTASTLSATKNITHGLGVVPVSVQLTAQSPGFAMVVTVKSATTFTVQGWTGSAATTTLGFDWRAVG